MKIRVLGAGWYGCHIALSLIEDGHEVTIFEAKNGIFKGASGSNPARIHLGFHYPRSKITRAFCQEHYTDFMAKYGQFTRAIPTNIYAVAKDYSLVDYGNYIQTLKNEIPFIPIENPEEFGLRNVEGAILTGERHIVIGKVRNYFYEKLQHNIVFNTIPPFDDDSYDWTIDCTFCANQSAGVDRYEPCVTAILQDVNGKNNPSITIMDGQFPSIYAWDTHNYLYSLTSAKLTPLGKYNTWKEANDVINNIGYHELYTIALKMIEQMRYFYPNMPSYTIYDCMCGIRAQPLSGADARFVDVAEVAPSVLRVRAGKIDAIIYAEKLIKDKIYYVDS